MELSKQQIHPESNANVVSEPHPKLTAPDCSIANKPATDCSIANTPATEYPRLCSGTVFYEIKKLFIGGIKRKTTLSDLEKHFSRFGEVKSVDIKCFSHNLEPRGFGFVEFETIEGMNKALAFRYHMINNKLVELRRALLASKVIKIFVKVLNGILTYQDIQKYFEKIARVLHISIPFGIKLDQSQHFFVEICIAIEHIDPILKNYHEINGIKVLVHKARKYGHQTHLA